MAAHHYITGVIADFQPISCGAVLLVFGLTSRGPGT